MISNGSNPEWPSNGNASRAEVLFYSDSPDKQSALDPDKMRPHLLLEQIDHMLDKLHEPKMMERLRDLLQHLPSESQHLLESLEEEPAPHKIKDLVTQLPGHTQEQFLDLLRGQNNEDSDA